VGRTVSGVVVVCGASGEGLEFEDVGAVGRGDAGDHSVGVRLRATQRRAVITSGRRVAHNGLGVQVRVRVL